MGKKLTHKEFLDRVLQRNKHYIKGEFDIVGKYQGSNKSIECHCNIHNVEWFPVPNDLWRGSGCPYCSSNCVLIGFNDMWTTRPDVAALLQDSEDGYRYTSSSNQKTWFICPDCQFPNYKRINNVSALGVCCQRCSNGVSYPNKFSRALLDQLPIDKFDCEYQPEWAKPYYYDNHFWYNGIEYILEMDGYLHFVERKFHQRTLEQIQEKDHIKDDLALQHNIHMIRINCIKCEMEYIKKNIINSQLNEIFDLSVVDWDLCDKESQRNIAKKACELYMSREYNVAKISNILHVNQSTTRRYLKNGSKYGWCDYGLNKAVQSDCAFINKTDINI